MWFDGRGSGESAVEWNPAGGSDIDMKVGHFIDKNAAGSFYEQRG